MNKILFLIATVSLLIIGISFFSTSAEAFESGSCHYHPGQVCEYYSEWTIGEENYGSCTTHKPDDQLPGG